MSSIVSRGLPVMLASNCQSGSTQTEKYKSEKEQFCLLYTLKITTNAETLLRLCSAI